MQLHKKPILKARGAAAESAGHSCVPLSPDLVNASVGKHTKYRQQMSVL